MAFLAGNLASACGGADETTVATAPAKCPFILDPDSISDELPKSMARDEVGACLRYFARIAKDHRFAPGSHAFTTNFCTARVYRHAPTRGNACQQVRIAACRFAVGDGNFTNLNECLASSPPVRRLLRVGGASVSVLLQEPWSLWADYTPLTIQADNEIRATHAFSSIDGQIRLYAPPRTAWDARAAREIPFPGNIVDLLQRNPYLRIVGTRSLNLPGIDATQIDLTVLGGDPNARKHNLCGDVGVRDESCVAISADSDSEGYAMIYLQTEYLFQPHHYRLMDLRTPTGRAIIVIDGFERFRDLAGVESVLRTMHPTG